MKKLLTLAILSLIFQNTAAADHKKQYNQAEDYDIEISLDSPGIRANYPANRDVDALIIYSDPYFQGRSLVIDDDLPYVGDRMNDKLSSFKIPQGWEVRFYEHHNFQGKYFTRTADSTDSNFAKGFDNTISSVRILKKDSDSKIVDDAVIIYSEPSFRGRSLVINNDLPYVGDRMNDKLSSFKIPEGWEVRFYEHINYQGKYYTRKANSTDRKFAKSFNDTISSVRILKKNSASTVTEDEVVIYSDRNFRGVSRGFKHDLPYVGDRMNDKLSSFRIPQGWEVRFYEHINYQGKSFTRSANSPDSHFARDFDNSISSVRILKKR